MRAGRRGRRGLRKKRGGGAWAGRNYERAGRGDATPAQGRRKRTWAVARRGEACAGTSRAQGEEGAEPGGDDRQKAWPGRGAGRLALVPRECRCPSARSQGVSLQDVKMILSCLQEQPRFLLISLSLTILRQNLVKLKHFGGQGTGISVCGDVVGPGTFSSYNKFKNLITQLELCRDYKLECEIQSSPCGERAMLY